MKISKAKSSYDFIRESIKKNKSLKNLTDDDIDIIIFNRLKAVAESRRWIKDIPVSVVHHR